MLTIFTLASGRSGTHFLYELLRRNTTHCICRHETYSYSNPSMFGRPIDDYATGNLDAIRTQVAIKARWIARQRAGAYVETSHALLKSWFAVATEFFPKMRLIHLVRDVLRVAKSEANREELTHRWRLPFRYARCADGGRYFRWALTGKEPIFQPFCGKSLTRFQWYILQWIEIENRAMRMIDQFGLTDRCVTLHSPDDLNDIPQLERLIGFLGLQRRGTPLTFAGRKNRTPGAKTVISEEDRRQAAAVICELPAETLAIFGRPPYDAWPWSALLRDERAAITPTTRPIGWPGVAGA